jgi:hypothetical protein
MALNAIVVVLYVIDMLYDTVINDNWGIGELICKNGDSFELNSGCQRQLIKLTELGICSFLF